jgi:hypothetical protein
MPISASELFGQVNSLAHLLKLVEDGGVSLALGDVAMSAARSSFEAIPKTADKRGQVWTCIGHLDTAQHAYERFILSRTPGNVSGIRVTLDELANIKRRFVLIVKSVCYKYLNEEPLCRESFSLSQQEVSIGRNIPRGVFEIACFAAYFTFTLGLGYIAEGIYMQASGIEKEKERYTLDDATFYRLKSILVPNVK